MKLNRLKVMGVLLLAVGAFVLPGCGLCDDGNTKPAPVAQKQPEKQPEPVKQPTAAKAAPKVQEAPRVGMITESMAFPTGDRATSALLIERRMPAEVVLGQAFEYEICATNISKLTLKDVGITDDCTNFTVTSSTPPATKSASNGLMWNLGTLAPGETKCVKVQGTATNTGKVTSCAAPTFSAALCIETNVVQPALKIVHTATAEALTCDPIQLSCTVTNTGSGAARNVKVNHNIPAGLKCQGDMNMHDVGTLAAGESRTFNMTCQADKSGSYQSQCTATADGGLTASSETHTTVVRQPVLTITKTCRQTQFIGANTTMDIVVKNTGDGAAKDCMVEDMLPANGKFVSASAGGTASAGKVTWNLGTLAPNDSKTVSVVVSSDVAGKLTNTASARAYCAAAVQATCSTDYTGIPALLLEVVDSPDPVQLGTDTTYTIEVTNQGSATATNVKITCTVPAEETFLAAGGQTAGSASGNTITFAPLATLAPKAKATWTVKVKAKAEGDVRFRTSMIADQLKSTVDETESTNLYQ